MPLEELKRPGLPLRPGPVAMSAPLATFNDTALIKRVLAGQAECFTILMDRHSVAVKRRIAWMSKNANDGDDLMQEVLLKVWRHLSTFRSESSFRNWMIRVATNEVLQLFRQERRKPLCQTFGELDTVASPGKSPYQSVVCAQLTEAVRSAVVTLPAIYQQVLILRDIKQLTTRETAQGLRLSIPAVKTRLSRARLMLRVALERSRIRGSTSSETSKR
jgi:RNA polymerase sigma-70 factor (ECF subfamily)